MINHSLIIFASSIIIPSCNKVLCNITQNKQTKKIIWVTLSQYTNWNLVLIFINTFYKDGIYELFIAINSLTILIVYHVFRFADRDKIHLIPNIPNGSSFIFIDIISFFVHILPAFAYIHNFANTKMSIHHNQYLVNHNVGYDVALFNVGWALQCFQSFDPAPAYYQTNNIYKYWCFTLLCHICNGYILQSIYLIN